MIMEEENMEITTTTQDDAANANKARKKRPATNSVRLLNKDCYEATYGRIKEAHGRQILKEWTEKTDPTKYVFEDCGIAAYLLELWHAYNITPRGLFADLGCGNGLLVHLLASEGVPGFGVDVRERKIWANFRAQGDDLRQVTLDPSDVRATNELLGNVDFLIGNHSDELTPWVPVMAARLNCNFFLLPCCPYNFFSKFMKQIATPRHRALVGGVQEQFYAYLQYICERLGFRLMVDDLRIPSRKKKCFIGIVPESGLAPNLERVIASLLEEAKLHKDRFTPRPPKEEVRNCMKIPWEIRMELAQRIVHFLIQLSPEENYNGWHFGGQAHLSTLGEHVLTPADRENLSRQDKGLQTFLRNFHQVFAVQKAVVSVRRWPEVSASFAAKMKGVKRSYCWFHKYHPEGCPLSAEECSYAHK